MRIKHILFLGLLPLFLCACDDNVIVGDSDSSPPTVTFGGYVGGEEFVITASNDDYIYEAGPDDEIVLTASGEDPEGVKRIGIYGSITVHCETSGGLKQDKQTEFVYEYIDPAGPGDSAKTKRTVADVIRLAEYRDSCDEGWWLTAVEGSLAASTENFHQGTDNTPHFIFELRCEHATSCTRRSYNEYLDRCPRVREVVGAMGQATRELLWQYVEEIERTDSIALEEPVNSIQCVEPDTCRFIDLTGEEAVKIYTAKVAHALWLDKNHKVPWRLCDYSAEELRGLLDQSLLIDHSSSRDWFSYIVDHSPSEVYGYMVDNGLIRSDVMSTVYAVLENVRGNDGSPRFKHGGVYYNSEGEIIWEDPKTARTLYAALTDTTEGAGGSVRISRNGCQSMAKIVVGMLRSVNVPGYDENHGNWYEWGHNSAVWPVIERVMPHGDDVYTATLREVPVDEFLVSFDFYENPANISVCGNDPYCLTRRHHVLLATQYPCNYIKNCCCFPSRCEADSCPAYMTNRYDAFLTEDELAELISTYEGLTCP
jgi:hypothetical protein